MMRTANQQDLGERPLAQHHRDRGLMRCGHEAPLFRGTSAQDISDVVDGGG
jgi:hypothetical protein